MPTTDLLTPDGVLPTAAEQDLSARALHVLQSVFGYPAFRGSQADIVDLIARGGDALVLMPTGGGKSLCYQIPSLLRKGCGIVISPLIALMQDQVDALAELGVRAAFLNSSQSFDESLRVERALRQGELDLLYVAPERLLTQRCLDMLDGVQIALFAIDEAHCVSQWGHDFRPEYIRLSVLHERYPAVPRIALTATADGQTRTEIIDRLQLGEAQQFISSFDRPNIRYQIVEKENVRRQLLDFITTEHAGEAGIVYCLSRKKVEETAEFLRESGLNALAYHAGMDATTRSQHQSRFLREDSIIMVATMPLAWALINRMYGSSLSLDLPRSIEAYYQETGRAGRDGLPADAWMAYGLQDVVQQRRMIEESEADASFKRMQSARLEAMLGLCETLSCRRVRLLAYFDEVSEPCGNCDTCLNPPVSFDATEATQKLLSTIYRVGQRFGAVHVLEVLRGSDSEKVRQWRHHELSTFGVGADKSEAEWRAILRQTFALGLVEIDYDNYGSLRLPEAARAVLRGEQKIAMRRYQKPARQKRAPVRAGSYTESALSARQQQLFEKLRWWRMETARSHNLPAYVIFHDNTLREIARVAPKTLEQLRQVSGVGEKKRESYGEQIIALVGEQAAA